MIMLGILRVINSVEIFFVIGPYAALSVVSPLGTSHCILCLVCPA